MMRLIRFGKPTPAIWTMLVLSIGVMVLLLAGSRGHADDSPATQPATEPADQAATQPTTEPAPPLPTEDALKKMVTQSLLDFNAALKAGDFNDFHDHKVAKAFAAQVSAEDLLKSFQPFIDRKIDIGFIADSTPIFDQKVQFDGDIITTMGHYQTQPLRVRFQLQYYHEKGVWRLAGINVNVHPAAAEPPPPDTQPATRPASEPATRPD